MAYLATGQDGENVAQHVTPTYLSLRESTIRAGRDAIFNFPVADRPQKSEIEDMRTIAKWLSPLNYHQVHKDILDKVLTGTASWILEHPTFIEWMARRIETLWGWGIPGAGKSCLAAYVIDHLSKNLDAIVIFTYCQYKDELSATAILACLLKQLVESSEDAAQYVSSSLYATCLRTDTKPSKSELLTCLRECVQRCTTILVVIDALDELKDDTRLELLPDLLSLHKPIFVTSRPLSMPSRFVATEFLIRAPDHAIQAFISQRITSTSIESLLRLPMIRDEIITGIVQKCDGMFLLAALQIEALASGGIINTLLLREAVARLPTSLDEQYMLSIQRIRRQNTVAQALAFRTILFITYATTTLMATELLDALTVDEGEFTVQKEAGATDEILVLVCQGLVTIEKKSGTINLIHYTAQKFFESQDGLFLGNPHMVIADVSAVYLSHANVDSKDVSSHSDLEATKTTHPFFPYACLNLGYHTYKGCGNGHEPVSPAITHLFSVRSTLPISLISLGDYIDHVKIVHFAALYGLMSLFHENTMDIGVKSLLRASPLFYACLGGHVPLVQHAISLNSGASHATVFGATALHAACRSGNASVMSILLPPITSSSRTRHLLARSPIRTNVNAKMEDGVTALHIAAENGFTDIARAILSYGEGVDPRIGGRARWTSLNAYNAAINIQDKRMQTALMKAAGRGHRDIVELLLNKEGVDVTSKDVLGWTALHMAAENGHKTSVELLLKASDVDVGAMDSLGWTAIHRAALSGHDKVVELLLCRREIDINAQNHQGWTLLHLAAQNGRLSVVRLLLEFPGIDVSMKTLLGWTALHRAAIIGNEGIICQLLHHRHIDVNAASNEGWTPLHSAAFYGHEAAVRHLLETPRINASAKSALGWTALHRAAMNGHVAVVRCLVQKHGIDPNVYNNEKWTPLHLAAQNGHLPVVQALIELPNINISAKNILGWTALHRAAQNGHTLVVQQLLSCPGADINCKDGDEWTPLHRAAENGHIGVIRLLLDSPHIRINEKTNNHLTSLHLAAMKSHNAVIRGLAGSPGINVDIRDALGRTALHFLAQNEDEAGFRLLLRYHRRQADESMDDISGFDSSLNTSCTCPTPSSMQGERHSAQLSDICSTCFGHYFRKYRHEIQEMRQVSEETMVSEYADEIFEYTQDSAEEILPTADYMDIQKELTWEMRQTLIDWLLQIHDKFYMEAETLWLSVNILDRALSKRQVALSKLQLAGMASMLLAAKYEEVHPPSLQEFHSLSLDAYSKEELIRAELIILRDINFSVSRYCSPYSWIHKISRADDFDSHTLTLAKFLVEVTLLDHRFLQMKPSLVAAVGMYSSRKMLGYDWSDLFVFHSGYTEEQLVPSHNAIVQKLGESEFDQLYVYQKYNRKRFLKASDFALRWVQSQVAT